MKYAKLIFKNILRNKRRTLLTISSLVISLFLIITLATVLTELERGTEEANPLRLVSRHAVSLAFPLPIADVERIKAVPGVKDAMPFAIIAQAVLRDPSSIGVRIMSWIPIYTPFTMLARMGAGVPLWEVVGCGVTLAAFIAIEVVLLGRVFRASLLSAGSKPNLVRLARLMAGWDAE